MFNTPSFQSSKVHIRTSHQVLQFSSLLLQLHFPPSLCSDWNKSKEKYTTVVRATAWAYRIHVQRSLSWTIGTSRQTPTDVSFRLESEKWKSISVQDKARRRDEEEENRSLWLVARRESAKASFGDAKYLLELLIVRVKPRIKCK